jgi:sulfite reductase alpha subunit-like flavoprotein
MYRDEVAWIVYPLAALSAVVLSVSSVLLYIKIRAQAAREEEGKYENESDDRQIVRLFFGTQTGTAEKFAKELATSLVSSYGSDYRFVVQDMESYDHENCLSRELMVFFLMATYGDGEPTDNAQKFVEWLEQKSESTDVDSTEPYLKVRRSFLWNSKLCL